MKTPVGNGRFTNHDPHDLVLTKLRQVGSKPKKTSNGWESQCPAHNDRSASLSIGTGNDDRVLLRCHAGCSVPDICDSLDIRQSDLFTTGDVELPQWKPPKPSRTLDCSGLTARHSQALTAAHRTAFAKELGMPVESLSCLPYLGYDCKEQCISHAELDADGVPIGIVRRLKDGVKKCIAGGHRGIYRADNWQEHEGPVFAVEGYSDTLAGTYADMCCVGRPSNTGGISILAELLQSFPLERDIIVVGENDQKEDGSHPGYSGAVETATKLKEQLNRPIKWTLPPEECKDIRGYLTSSERGETLWNQRGRDLVAKLTENAVDVATKDDDPVNTTADVMGPLFGIAMEQRALVGFILGNATIRDEIRQRIHTLDAFTDTRLRIIADVAFRLADSGKTLDAQTLTAAIEAEGLTEPAGGSVAVESLIANYPDVSEMAESANASKEQHVSAALADEPKQTIGSEDSEKCSFPVEVFPDDLQHCIKEVSRATCSALDATGSLMLPLASLAIGNTRKIGLLSSWTEPAIVWMAVVAMPGESKSPVLRTLAAPLFKWQETLGNSHDEQMLDYERQREKYEADKKGDGEVTAPSKPSYTHVYTTDATTEALTGMLSKSPRGLGLHQDEITALIGGLDQYKKGGKGRDRQFLLSAWAGEKIKTDRKSDNGIPLICKTPFLNIWGGIQPELLGSLQDETGKEDGFAHRFLYTYPPIQKLVPWGYPGADPWAIKTWTNCFDKLVTLPSYPDTENGGIRPWVCNISTAGTEAWKKWYDKKIAIVDNGPQRARGAARKNIAYAARLSLVMQMLYWALDGETNSQVDERAIVAGCKLADYYSSQFNLILARLHDKADDIKARQLFEWVKERGGNATVRDITKGGPHWARKASVAEKYLRDIDDRGWGNFQETAVARNGKSKKWIELN